MKKINSLSFKILSTILIIVYSKIAISEPFVVLEYRGNNNSIELNSNNSFLKDNNHSQNHTVLKNETLGDIILKYYGYNMFNKGILSLSIVQFNKNAFVRNNPNFLFAGKKIYLPSVNEIKNSVIKHKKKNKLDNSSEISSQIYFFGG